MPTWEFPNAVAKSVKRSARLRGQHRNRIEIRDFDERNWPPRYVRWGDPCDAARPIGRHFALPDEDFCTHCGGLVKG